MRYIRLTDELKQKAIQDFTTKLNTDRFSASTINFSFDLQADLEDDKAIINIRPEAWLKMWGLVSSEKGEIGWHGVVERHGNNMFEIKDILIYPQFVTGVTVTTDDVGYGNWLHKDLSEEQINHLRFHGHSHVNMSTSPSGVDTNWYNEILQSLSEDDFYIFAILNKRQDYFIEIYDLKNNKIYEKKDIVVNVILENRNYLTNWITLEKKKALQEREVGTGRLNHVLKSVTKPTTDDFEEELLSLTEKDLENQQTRIKIILEIEDRAVYTGYFGLGYLEWQTLAEDEKISIVQAYYEAKKYPKPTNNSKVKRKINTRPRYEDWGY